MSPSLERLPILALDCQTTGSTPDTGHLLEVAFLAGRAAANEAAAPLPESHLVVLPNGARLPPAISRLTGIGSTELSSALSRKDVWQRLIKAVSVPGGTVICVAHFARFEERFLRALHGEIAPQAPFPLRFMCTHEIARRLFPDLPRRGLRALAGYFGFPLGEHKRAATHAAATLQLWRRLVGRLRGDVGVTTLDELCAFLAGPVPARSGSWMVPLAREKRLTLPDAPGVYRLLAGDGSVLYVGKASSLRARVNSYYRRRRGADKLLEMVSQVSEVATTQLPTSLEAALLEAEEIRCLDPPYNRSLRDQGQGVWFFSADLRSARRRADRRHRLGPFIARDLIATLRSLSGLREGAVDAGRMRDFGIDPRRLAPGVWPAGLAAFAAAHGLDQRTSPRALLALGHRLRVQPHEEIAAEDGGQLSPAGVQRHLESRLATAAQMRLRGCWLVLLSESSVAWQTNRSGPSWRCVRIARGRPASVQPLQTGEAPPIPEGWQRSVAARRRGFDRATYDRLRVLSSELRRIASQGRPVTVCLGPQRCLDAGRVKRVLELV